MRTPRTWPQLAHVVTYIRSVYELGLHKLVFVYPDLDFNNEVRAFTPLIGVTLHETGS